MIGWTVKPGILKTLETSLVEANQRRKARVSSVAPHPHLWSWFSRAGRESLLRLKSTLAPLPIYKSVQAGSGLDDPALAWSEGVKEEKENY